MTEVIDELSPVRITKQPERLEKFKTGSVHCVIHNLSFSPYADASDVEKGKDGWGGGLIKGRLVRRVS